MSQIILSDPQRQVCEDPARFRGLFAGRRFGKTIVILHETSIFASIPKSSCWYIAPTYRQAKLIAWQIFKDHFDKLNWTKKTNETDLTILLKNKTLISLKGADKPDSLRGVDLHFVAFDEVADIDKYVWEAVVSPTLASTEGHALFAGTPKGRNWVYKDIWLPGQDGSDPEFSSYKFTTIEGGNVSEEEIARKRRTTDPDIFRQEYEADWVDFSGRAYNFRAENNVVNGLRDKYRPEWPLIFCFDFNVDPGVAVVLQEFPGSDGRTVTCVIDEVWIPKDSNTLKVCKQLIDNWGNHKGMVYCYGDSTGGSKGSAKVMGSDWDLINVRMKEQFLARAEMKYRRNPSERGRINSMNARMRNADDEYQLFVDSKCVHIIHDLEHVELKNDGSGKLNKTSRSEEMKILTHISDALGYYVAQEFPIKDKEQASDIWLPGRRNY